MATTYKTPGVYIQEISKFPPSVAQVETAIPAFIGYTEKAIIRGVDQYAPQGATTTTVATATDVPAVAEAKSKLDTAITELTTPEEEFRTAIDALDTAKTTFKAASPEDQKSDADNGVKKKLKEAEENVAEKGETLATAQKTVQGALESLKSSLESEKASLALAEKIKDAKKALDEAVAAIGDDGISGDDQAKLAKAKEALDALVGGASTSTTPTGSANKPGDPIVVRITSLLEYENFFGKAENETSIKVDISKNGEATVEIPTPSKHNMYYSLQAFFANGGGPGYIVSVGPMEGTLKVDDFKKGLTAIEKEDEVTLIVCPESLDLDTPSDFRGFYDTALIQCNKLQDRFVVMDAKLDAPDMTVFNAAKAFRDSNIGNNNLKYGAAYGPRIETIFDYQYEDTDVEVDVSKLRDANDNPIEGAPPTGTIKLDKIEPKVTSPYGSYYPIVKSAIAAKPVVLPAAPLVVGVYASVDNDRGVWKAPANVSLSSVVGPTIKISSDEQENLNIDTSGKSINAIRTFTGKGTLIWGARTLAGNDNEWRYVPVRRFFNMAEESIKKATEGFVFEPNDSNTWTKIKAMIENFLTLQWRAGALQGAKPEQSFYVKIGLNETMTALDILEGRLIIEIGMAVVRPAEFIILKFSHKMAES